MTEWELDNIILRAENFNRMLNIGVPVRSPSFSASVVANWPSSASVAGTLTYPILPSMETSQG